MQKVSTCFALLAEFGTAQKLEERKNQFDQKFDRHYAKNQDDIGELMAAISAGNSR